jgi:hypothetical protein
MATKAINIIHSNVLGMYDAEKFKGDRDLMHWIGFGERPPNDSTVGLPPNAHSSCRVLGKQ